MNRTMWLQDRRMQKFRDVLSRWEHKELSAMEAGRFWAARSGSSGITDGATRRMARMGWSTAGWAKPLRSVCRSTRWPGCWHSIAPTTLGWNVKHFHEHLQRQHSFRWGYTWTKLQLQAAGLVDRAARRGRHRRKRPLFRDSRQGGRQGAAAPGRPGLARLGIDHIPAYSPQARGRSEPMFGTLQRRLPNESSLFGIRDIDAANRYIREVYLPLP